MRAHETLYLLITDAFIWCETEEGSEYWSKASWPNPKKFPENIEEEDMAEILNKNDKFLEDALKYFEASCKI